MKGFHIFFICFSGHVINELVFTLLLILLSLDPCVSPRKHTLWDLNTQATSSGNTQPLADGLAAEWIAKWKFCVNPLQNNGWHCRSVQQRPLLWAGRPRGDHSRTVGVSKKYYSSYANNVISHGISSCNCGMIIGGVCLKRVSLQEFMFIQAAWSMFYSGTEHQENEKHRGSW